MATEQAGHHDPRSIDHEIPLPMEYAVIAVQSFVSILERLVLKKAFFYQDTQAPAPLSGAKVSNSPLASGTWQKQPTSIA